MARGDECKTATKATHACKAFDVTPPLQKMVTNTSYVAKKEEPKKNYGAWGPIFKDKKYFTEMHHC